MRFSGALRELQHLHYSPDNKLLSNVYFPGHELEEVYLTLALEVVWEQLPGSGSEFRKVAKSSQSEIAVKSSKPANQRETEMKGYKKNW